MTSDEHPSVTSFMTSSARYYGNSAKNKDMTFLVQFQNINDMKCNGGMQDNNNSSNNNQKYGKEIKTLVRLFGDSITEEELKQKIEKHHGNIETVIRDLIQQSIEKESKSEEKSKANELKNVEQVKKKKNHFILFHISLVNEISGGNKSVQKETEKTGIGETKPGINLQGYCSNEICLASKAKLPVWINIGFNNITFTSNKTSFSCPDCKKPTITSIVKAMFYNSEHSICASGDSIPLKDNNYQCSYSIKSELSYELKANKIRQHAKSIEDLRERSESAMNSIEIRNL
ncbi:hypothetical protein RFI_37121, partial [Reticulomyxa filosa]